MSSRRIKNKLYRYVLFYFPDSQAVGTAPTSIVCDGFQSLINVGNYVLVNWEGQPVWGNILMLHGKTCSVQLALHAFCRHASIIFLA